MCGRYVLTADAQAIQEQFNLETVPSGIQPRYNIAPTQPVAVIANDAPRELTHFRWGLIPFWAKDPSIGNRMINARSETLHEKNSFRHAYKRRRCLIPANGFYEWMKDGQTKRPMFVHLHNQALFAFAGLWERWQGPDGDEIRTCTIITSEPNEKIKALHHRMAVILREGDYDTWLSPDELPPDVLQPLLRPLESEHMDYYKVSTLVNSPANDTPECIAPVSEQPSLL